MLLIILLTFLAVPVCRIARAGEVEEPTKTFPRALGLAVVLVVTVYLVPLAVAIGVSDNVQFDLTYGEMNCTEGSPLQTMLAENATVFDSLCTQAKQSIIAAGQTSPPESMLLNISYLSGECTGGCGTISAYCDLCPSWVLQNVSAALVPGNAEDANAVYSATVDDVVYGLTAAGGNTFATSHWNDAMYAELGGKVGGDWLKAWIVISITIACVGMYEADLSAGAYQLLGMAERGMIPASDNSVTPSPPLPLADPGEKVVW